MSKTKEAKIVVYKSGMGCTTFCFLLTLVFVVAKLTGLVLWSWPVCFIPVMICPGIPLAITLIVLLFLFGLFMAVLPTILVGLLVWVLIEKVMDR